MNVNIPYKTKFMYNIIKTENHLTKGTIVILLLVHLLPLRLKNNMIGISSIIKQPCLKISKLSKFDFFNVEAKYIS